MPRNSFLAQVAHYFAGKPSLEEYCFVLPNHRSCKFLQREFDSAISRVYLQPAMMPITDFIASFAPDKVPVSSVEALFMLYECYRSLSGNEDYSFDKFVYWGNIVLNDFNDVDMHLINARDIFTNVRELREIQANYFDADLQEIVSHYFNVSIEGRTGDEEEFWRKNYTGDGSGDVKQKYLQLWQNLLPLYNSFNEALARQGKATMGGLYRLAAERVSAGAATEHSKYVIVGFNMLSTSEMAIFKRLANQGKALFFWDTASPAFAPEYSGNSAVRYINFFKKEFPEPSDFADERVSEFPQIEVVAVPSGVGQAKYTSTLLRRLIDEGAIADNDNAINTAVVLPDETLFIPLLNSLSPDINNINVTMGYPLRSSDIASLMRVVAAMHKRARRQVGEEWTYYRADVKTVLSHPIVKTCFGREALEVLYRIDNENLFAVPQAMFAATPFAPIFTTADNIGEIDDVLTYVQHLIDFCHVVTVALSQVETNEDADDATAPPATLQQTFVTQYARVLGELKLALTRWQVPPCENTLFMLIDRLASLYSVPFEGEPLRGLQVMGMLETRCLDFENIIILSCNETKLPRKFKINSFISDFLRRGFGMNTTAHQDAMWAYHFYRMIGGARRVFMLHNTSAQDMGAGEVSRYVTQLELIYGCNIKHTELTLSLPVPKDIKIDLPKTDRVLQQLQLYTPGGGNKRLSASSLNDYITCPLLFYLSHVERLNADNEAGEFMDAPTFGTIVHESLQELYYPNVNGKPREGDYKVTGAMIKDFMKRDLEKVIRRKVNEHYVHSEDLDAPLTGEPSIVSVALKMYAENALNYDLDLLGNTDIGFFRVMECERKHPDSILALGNHRINFTYTADRIDRINDGPLRLVDYKTGSARTRFSKVDDLFGGTNRAKAILQVMLYCNAYALENETDEPIQPIIYTLRDMKEAKVRYGKNELTDYHTINDEFLIGMAQVIDGFFDKDKPFSQTLLTGSSAPCRYCTFCDFCRR